MKVWINGFEGENFEEMIEIKEGDENGKKLGELMVMYGGEEETDSLVERVKVWMVTNGFVKKVEEVEVEYSWEGSWD